MVFIVGVIAGDAVAGGAVGAEQGFQFGQVVALGAKPGNVPAAGAGFLEKCVELALGVAPERVAVDQCRLDAEADEDILECMADGGQAGPGGTGDCDD